MSADELKAKGNEAFSAKDFKAAIQYFTEAIELDESNHVLFSNRSASFASLGQFEAALRDAEKTVSIKSDWAKGYSRKGAALQGLGDNHSALEAYTTGLKLDPNNQQMKDGVAACEEAIAKEMQGGNNSLLQIAQLFTAPDTLDKLRANPKTASLASDPSFLTALAAIRRSPSAIQQHFDEKMILAMSVLMGRGGAGGFPEGMDTEEDEAGAAEAEAKAEEQRERAKREREERAKREAEEKEKAAREAEAKAKAEAEAANPAKAAATAEKDLGTAAYKSKDFPAALSHYRAAEAQDPTDMVYALNISAVLFEQKEYEECAKEALRAAEIGQENRGDFKAIARAFARAGKAYGALKKHEDAIKCYNKALTNHRTPETLNAKKEVERELKEFERLSYLDVEKSLMAKERGNEAFGGGDWPLAVREYTEAIKRNPEDGKLYSNRAAAYMKLMELTLALKDCDECIRLAPTFVRGYTRRGACLSGLKKHSEALRSFTQALELDPNHPEATEGARAARRALNEEAGTGTPEERYRQAMADPEVVEIMQDPVMQAILQQMQQDPKALKEHMKNKEIEKKITKLMEAGIIQIR